MNDFSIKLFYLFFVKYRTFMSICGGFYTFGQDCIR